MARYESASYSYQNYPQDYGNMYGQYSDTTNRQGQSYRVPSSANQYPQKQYNSYASPSRGAVSISSTTNGRSENNVPVTFYCLHQPCADKGVGFARKADLQRHIDVTHLREQLQLVNCQYPGCHRLGDYGFTRKDKMVDHMREVHKADIPKRRASKDPSTSPVSSNGSQ